MNQPDKNEELQIASDLCQEYGFARNAEILREIAAGQERVFMVVKKGYEYGDDFYYFEEHLDEPQTIFRSQQEALLVQEMLTAQRLRTLNPNALYNPSRMSDSELERKARKILGRSWTMPDFRGLETAVFPEQATDDQLVQIAKLFEIELFQVIELNVDF